MRNSASTKYQAPMIKQIPVAKIGDFHLDLGFEIWDFDFIIPHSAFGIPHLSQSSRTTKPLRFSRRN
jgi:hypothetical protein